MSDYKITHTHIHTYTYIHTYIHTYIGKCPPYRVSTKYCVTTYEHMHACTYTLLHKAFPLNEVQMYTREAD